MRFKVDENLHADVAAAFRNEGHDALTVYDQELQGSPDPDIASMCRREGRVLVTLDLDFANIREYPPENYAGLIVLRVANQSRPHVLGVISQIFAVLSEQPIAGHLWIVSESSVRIRSGTSADDSPSGGRAANQIGSMRPFDPLSLVAESKARAPCAHLSG